MSWRYLKFKLGMYLIRDHLVGKDSGDAMTESSVELDDMDGWTVTATARRTSTKQTRGH